MAANKTSLSAGEIIRAVLLDDPGVSALVSNIYPIVQVSEEALLPYVSYRRAELEAFPQKSGQPGADTVQVEINCFAEKYAESVEIAEAVRAALDCVSAEHGGMTMRGCYMSASQEDYQDGAFIQQLIFNIKI